MMVRPGRVESVMGGAPDVDGMGRDGMGWWRRWAHAPSSVGTGREEGRGWSGFGLVEGEEDVSWERMRTSCHCW